MVGFDGHSTNDGDKPLVSVVIPAYNAQTTLARALHSVADQTYRPLEVIVVDDASVDRTVEVVRAFDRLPVKLERLPRQGGAAAARNRGIAVAGGTFVAFLDADDEWLPEKTALQLPILRDPAVSFVTCDASLIGPRGKDLGLVNPDRERPHGEQGWKTLLRFPSVATPCVIARRSLLQAVGGFDPGLQIGEDQDLWIKLALRGPVHHVNRVMARVHDRHDSLSNLNRGRAKSATLPMIFGHLERQRPHLTKAEIADIKGRRLASVGRHSYESGDIADGLRFLTRAMVSGFRPLETAKYMISASPPMRFAKRLWRGAPALPGGAELARIPENSPPLLAVVVDTEGEFDWKHPYDRASRAVHSINHLHLAQRIHEKHGIVPTFVVDFTIVDDDNAVGILKEWFQSGRAIIGAHLQPWVNPPNDEPEELRNTYPGNLPYALEYRKLAYLTELIEKRFGIRPTIYKAGRYGLGPSTARILKSLGYEIDASILPSTDLRHNGGPNFSDFTTAPFWFGENLDLFEVPLTRGFTGALGRFGPALAPMVTHPFMERIHVPGVLARLGLLERSTLTPEGTELVEHQRLTRALLNRGQKVFCLTYHSSSLLPGATDYIRNEADRERFLANMDGYFTFFRETCGGRPTTLSELRTLCARGGAPAPATQAWPLDQSVALQQ